MTQIPIITYYDPRKPIISSADASSYRLRDAIFQAENKTLRIIAYVFRTLNQIERNYAQIEKQRLVSVWACERFDITGLDQFHLLTDHKQILEAQGEL